MTNVTSLDNGREWVGDNGLFIQHNLTEYVFEDGDSYYGDIDIGQAGTDIVHLSFGFHYGKDGSRRELAEEDASHFLSYDDLCYLSSRIQEIADKMVATMKEDNEE